MSSASYWQVYVHCPFYRGDDAKHKIDCEGVGDSSKLTLYFRKKCEFETQMKVFCCEHYPKCEIYRMLMGKYEE